MDPLALDDRLSLAFRLYPPCRVGADIGTDHGRLPCSLLEAGRCQRMILSDISPKALSRAAALVERRGLAQRTRLTVADGLDALTERVGCASMMGLGGRTIAQALMRGARRLEGAALLLSAHTDLEQVRRAVQAIGYHLVQERLCQAEGRWYVFLLAQPGQADYSPIELTLGPCLLRQGDPLLAPYAAWRQGVWAEKLRGLQAAARPDRAAMAWAEQVARAYGALCE